MGILGAIQKGVIYSLKQALDCMASVDFQKLFIALLGRQVTIVGSNWIDDSIEQGQVQNLVIIYELNTWAVNEK